ncbi:MAG TPA: hypothetical protein VGF34_03550 [Stellaceae bacterium]
MTTTSNSTNIGIKLDPALYTSPSSNAASRSQTGLSLRRLPRPGATKVSTIKNSGTITGEPLPPGVGIYLAPGGSVTNTKFGVIEGYTGIKIVDGPGTVINDGSILVEQGRRHPRSQS